MTNKEWAKLIDAKWDSLTEAMRKAAYDIGDGDGKSILRVELNKDGNISTYWAFEGQTSADVFNGNAIVISNYYGGDKWTPEWAEDYDAVAMLDDFRNFLFRDFEDFEDGDA